MSDLARKNQSLLWWLLGVVIFLGMGTVLYVALVG